MIEKGIHNVVDHWNCKVSTFLPVGLLYECFELLILYVFACSHQSALE